MAEDIEYTTITVPKGVKEDLDEQRGATPWGAFLEELRQEHADPITLNDAQAIAEEVTENIAAGGVKVNAGEIAERIKDELSMANEPGVEVDVDGLYKELDKLKELVEKVPEETAEEFGRKYR